MTQRPSTSTPTLFARMLRRALCENGIGGCADYVIFGSAVMKLHDLKDEIGDIDVFVSAAMYGRLRESAKIDRWSEKRPRQDDPPFMETHVGALAVHMFYTWTSRDQWIDAPEAFASAEIVQGLRCIPLELVAFHKTAAVEITRASGRRIAGSPWGKHERDLAVLHRAGIHLSRQHLEELSEGLAGFATDRAA